ncbi:Crp/Fnr family transcriptional regulator [Niastella sp. OAS944]|uniref:Crp/Fnr family transcriptional regulator n=1 Tax=Niastella sp. OAS944 TaxID=2664089 RepID=UPI00347A73B6|nr:CRP-like cAMP-binding protein [Chitinophagaceae bacterium OAS944]
MHESLINRIQQFVPLSDTEKELIRQLFKVKTFARGEYFLKEGQICQHVGFIQKGLVRYYINKEGEELIYGFGMEGYFACNYESFLDHSISTKNIQFIEDSTLLMITHAGLQQFYSDIKGGERFGRLIAEHIFVESVKQISSLYSDPPELRYRKFLESYPELLQRIPQYHISSYVGVKPQSLSRIRKRILG